MVSGCFLLTASSEMPQVMQKTHEGLRDALLGTGSCHRPGLSGLRSGPLLGSSMPGALLQQGRITLIFGHSLVVLAPAREALAAAPLAPSCLNSALLAPGSQRAQSLGVEEASARKQARGCLFLLRGVTEGPVVPAMGTPCSAGL